MPQAECDAWNKHDAHELSRLLADDGNFVTVATVYLHGRADYEKFHARLLAWRFKDSTFTSLETTVRFLRPDIAVVHWSWKMTGDKNFDGTPRAPRFGLMTMVAEKREGAWLIVVAQNTNALLGVPGVAGHQDADTHPRHGHEALTETAEPYRSISDRSVFPE